MKNFLYSVSVWAFAFGASIEATTFAPENLKELYSQNHICAVTLGEPTAIEINSAVAQQYPILEVIRCFHGEVTAGSTLSLPGGRLEVKHESGTTEVITTRIPGVPQLKAGSYILALRPLTENSNSHGLASWNSITPLQKIKDEFKIIRKEKHQAFLDAQAKSDAQAFLNQDSFKSLDAFAAEVEAELKK